MAKKDLGDFLIERRIIGKDQLAEARALAKNNGGKVHEVLINQGYATSEQVMQAMADLHGYEFFDLRDVPIPPHVVELVPESVARENAVIPLAEEDGALKVLTSDPFDYETQEKLQFILNRKVDIALATRESILEAINRNYGQMGDESADSMLQEFTDTAIDFTETEEGQDGAAGEEVDELSAPIVRLVQLMIGEAVQLRASDIHVEPFEDRVRIRYRIDGVLVERDSPPRRLLGALLSRIKILAKMDIAERRRCQDGRIKITAGGKELDLRVSMLPTSHGQSCVMRLLDKDNIKVGVRQLGLGEARLQGLSRPDPPAEWDCAGDGAHGVWENYDALRRSQRAQPPRPQNHHRRGSGRVLPAWDQPGRGKAQYWTGLCEDHTRDAAAGTQRDPGR